MPRRGCPSPRAARAPRAAAAPPSGRPDPTRWMMATWVHVLSTSPSRCEAIITVRVSTAQAADQLVELLAGAHVQARRGLVQDQERRVPDQAPRPVPLAAPGPSRAPPRAGRGAAPRAPARRRGPSRPASRVPNSRGGGTPRRAPSRTERNGGSRVSSSSTPMRLCGAGRQVGPDSLAPEVHGAALWPQQAAAGTRWRSSCRSRSGPAGRRPRPRDIHAEAAERLDRPLDAVCEHHVKVVEADGRRSGGDSFTRHRRRAATSSCVAFQTSVWSR